MVKEKFRIQDTYQDLHSFMLVLMTIKTSLLEIGPDSSQVGCAMLHDLRICIGHFIDITFDF